MNLHRCKHTAARVAIMLLTLCGSAGLNDASAQKRGASGAQSRRRQPTPNAADSSASSYLEEGQRHADAGDWAAALKAYKQLLAINPRHTEAHMYVGDAYMNLGKYEEAFAAYKEAIRVAPSNAEAHYSLGEAYSYMEIYTAAVRPLVQATLLDPNYAEAQHGAGHAYLKQENFKEALVYLKRAVRLKNDYAKAHLSLGLTYLGLGELKAAEEQLKVLEGMDRALARELDKELRSVAGARPETDPRSSRADNVVVNLTPKPQPRKTETERKTEPERKAETERETSPAPDPPGPPAKTQKAESDPLISPQTQPQTQPSPVALAAPPSVDSATPLAAEESALGDKIKNSDDPAELVAYLKKYPAGEFAGLAKKRLLIFLESKTDEAGAPGGAQKQETAAAQVKTESSGGGDAPIAEPASRPTAGPRREPTIEETLRSLKEDFSNKLTYTITTPGEDPNVIKITSEVLVEYVPLRFENCRMEWRDLKDTLSVALSDLDPLGVKFEPRSKLNTTFSIPIWNLTIETVGGAGAIQEIKGDGSGAVNNYSSLDLQFSNKEKVEKLARFLQQAIKLCERVP